MAPGASAAGHIPAPTTRTSRARPRGTISAGARRATPSPGGPPALLTKTARESVVQVDHPAREAALVSKLELDPGIARKSGRTAAHHDRVDEQVVFVDQAGPDRLPGEPRPADADVGLGLGLQPPDRIGVELPLESGL